MTTFRSPTIALALTIHERPPKTLARVLGAIGGKTDEYGNYPARIANEVDQIIIALDRVSTNQEYTITKILEETCLINRVQRVTLSGEKGWRCSSAAWNAAFSQVSTELLVCISSDVEMAPGVTTYLRDALAAYPAVIFGKVEDENPDVGDQLKKGFTRKILCSSREPRPLGFIMGLPMWLVRATGGYDEEMMAGIWYEDGDWNQRLWNEGVPFVFDDNISGVHISHPRPLLDTPKGVRLQAINMQYMAKKWGCLNPFVRNQSNLQYKQETGKEGILYMLQTVEKEGKTLGGKLAEFFDGKTIEGGKK